MRYVSQQHPMGCFIASIAMVLDLSYEQVAETVPLPDMGELQRTGRNSLGSAAFDGMKLLATTHGKSVLDNCMKPFSLKQGFRYLGMLSTSNSLLTHVVAIDQNGIVFDPDPVNEQSRESWQAYDFMAIVEFRPL
jgi:hypothetical protein